MEVLGVATLAIGVISTLLGVWIGHVLTARHERSRTLAERRHRIYMLLLGVKQDHFWISAGDMPDIQGRAIRPEMKDRYWEGAWKILDELRTVDELPQLPAIIDALIGMRFEHEWQRAEALGKVIDELSRDVNPRYEAAMRQRDREAMALMARDGDEWWRRRGKIEPLIPAPGHHQRRARGSAEEDDGDEEGK